MDDHDLLMDVVTDEAMHQKSHSRVMGVGRLIAARGRDIWTGTVASQGGPSMRFVGHAGH